jgi:subtilisin family serine protease
MPPLRILLAALGLASTTALSATPAFADPTPDPDSDTRTATALPLSAAAVSSQILVRFKSDATQTQRNDAISRVLGAVSSDLQLGAAHLLTITLPGTRDSALAWMNAQPEVVWAEPNRLTYSTGFDTEQSYYQLDPYWPRQWGLANLGDNGASADADIDAPEAWKASKGAGVTVGVVDTGVDLTHPDLQGQLVAGSNFVGDGHATAADGAGHGTHVSGIIAAAENTIGIVGAAPAAKVAPLRALDDNGTGTSASVAAAFTAAGKQGLRIVNASVGSTTASRAESDAIAAYPNTLFVVAAGNTGANIDNGGGASYPCQYPLANVLCVGASDQADQISSFSNRGASSVDVFAPGSSIVSTWTGGTYQYASGTSMASPMVAATAAVVASEHPDWTAAQLKQTILDTADRVPSFSGSAVTGARVNMARAAGVYQASDGAAPAQLTGLRASAGVARIDLNWNPMNSADPAYYQVEAYKNGAWVEQAVTLDPTYSATGLTAIPLTFRVRAFDRSGDEGPPTEPITVTPLAYGEAPKAAAPTPGTVAKGATIGISNNDGDLGDADDAGTKGGMITGLKRTVVKGRIKGISFKLSAASKVTLSATSRTKTEGKAASAVTKTLPLKAGTNTVKFGTGLKLKSGSWKLIVATPASKASIVVAVK